MKPQKVKYQCGISRSVNGISTINIGYGSLGGSFNYNTHSRHRITVTVCNSTCHPLFLGKSSERNKEQKEQDKNSSFSKNISLSHKFGFCIIYNLMKS